ncbi:MAG: phosphoribosyltransferase [Planctomycetota bacterium]|nr:MAG: phosphoribosyltransferase [Planctomycetota bacterium]
MFRDRREAAERLAEALADLQGQRPLVLGIPRGGVPLARVLADRLGGEVDVVLVHKIGSPGNPEFAVGSVSEDGDVRIRPEARRLYAPETLQTEVHRQGARLRAQRERFTPGRPPIDPRGRVVVVVDDGTATGETMLAALRVVRRREPAELVAALPVASREAVARLRREADRVVALEVPAHFWAVGAHYRDFHQVDDEEVLAALAEGTE